MKTTMLAVLCIIFLILPGLIAAENTRVLVLLPNLFGANHYLTMEMFREFGWEITTTAVNQTVQPCFWGDPITVDLTVDEIDDITEYDCIAISPMRWYQNPQTAYSDIINSQSAMALITAANTEGLIIYATCAGVRVLAAADILQGVNITGKQDYLQEYIDAGANFLGYDIPAVIDGNIVTSTRGQYYYRQNAEAIMTAMHLLFQDAPEGGRR